MYSEPPRSAWFALGAPPTAWFLALNAGYFMVDWACGSGGGLLALHGVMLAMFALSVAAGITGLRLWRRAGMEWPGKGADVGARTRLIIVVATLGGGLFSIAILVFWLATAVLDPCGPGPRHPFSPSA